MPKKETEVNRVVASNKKIHLPEANLTDLYAYGISVFGEKERFNKWLDNPNRAFGYVRPLELLNKLSGIGEVKMILGRIEHGVYS